jgi:hypothetical protein
MNTRVFLDLEGTVINNWDDLDLEWRKCRALKRMLAEGNVRSVEIFSFAIYDDHDRQKWVDSRLGLLLSTHLEVDVTAFPLTVDEIKLNIQRSRGLFFEDRREFIQLLGKQEAFIQWAQSQMSGEFLLIDDMVQDVVFENLTTKHKVACLNIDSLCEEFGA